MKRVFIILMTLVSLMTEAYAQQLVMSIPSLKKGLSASVAIDDVVIGKPSAEQIGLQMSLTLLSSYVPQRRMLVVTPRLVAGADSLDFPAVELYGSWTYYQTVRSGIDDNAKALHLRARDARTGVYYAKTIQYRPWMERAALKFVAQEQDACGSVLGSAEYFSYARAAHDTSAGTGVGTFMATSSTTTIDTERVTTMGDIHHYHGTAYITFPVNSIELQPDYNGNLEELDGIANSIDSLTQHNRSLLRHLTLKGYASPEGSYSRNEALARGRVHSLRNYLVQHYDLSSLIISTDYEPEDWDGFRRHVAEAQYPEREALLRIIDSAQDPDAKLARIASSYPALYKTFLKEVFPKLRRTDYRLDYVAVDSAAVKSVVVKRDSTREVTPIGPMSAATSSADSTGGPEPLGTVAAFEETYSQFRTFRPLFAVKSNLLFDVIAAPNLELEVAFGRDRRWSVMAEVWCPWWRLGYNAKGKSNQYYRSDQRPTKHAYQLLTVGAEARYWLAPRCSAARPYLSGAFVGLYAAGGKYDLCYDGSGYQGEFTSFGISAGYSWPVARHWNVELSAAVGYVGGPKVHYQNEFDDARLIYRSNDNLRYVGPTKLKVSLVWIIGK